MTDLDLQTIVADANAVYAYRPNPISVNYEATCRRVVLAYSDGSERSFPVNNVEAIARLPQTARISADCRENDN